MFINPEIISHSDSEVPYTEGCLSVPDQYAEVMRPDHIRPAGSMSMART